MRGCARSWQSIYSLGTPLHHPLYLPSASALVYYISRVTSSRITVILYIVFVSCGLLVAPICKYVVRKTVCYRPESTPNPKWNLLVFFFSTACWVSHDPMSSGQPLLPFTLSTK
ncbi:hypothetical protein B0H12DRAFT_713684 [Mycena haematopus]|nr:hypothetical protein B0H12DRAFT_713684 [Mycena haematopus]